MEPFPQRNDAADKISMMRPQRGAVTTDTIWLFIGHSASFLGALLMVRLLTSYLEPAQYGHLALSLTLLTLVGQLVSGPLAAAVARYYSIASEREGLEIYAGSVRRLIFYFALVVLIVSAIAAVISFFIFGLYWTKAVLGVFTYALFTGANSVFIGILNAARRRRAVAIFQILEWSLKLGAVLVVIAVFEASQVNIIFAFCCATSAMLAAHFLVSMKLAGAQVSAGHSSKLRNEILAYSWPFSIWGVFTWAQLSSDRWALELFEGAEVLGLFAVLYQIGYAPLSQLVRLTIASASPLIYDLAGDASDAGRASSAHNMGLRLAIAGASLTAGFFFIATMLHREVFEIVVGPGYEKSSIYLPWVVSAGGLFGIGQILSLNLMARMLTRQLLLIKVVASCFGVLANVIGAYTFGLLGIIIALNFFSFIYVALFFLVPSGEGAITEKPLS